MPLTVSFRQPFLGSKENEVFSKTYESDYSIQLFSLPRSKKNYKHSSPSGATLAVNG